jgi:hypothetical protein
LYASEELEHLKFVPSMKAFFALSKPSDLGSG